MKKLNFDKQKGRFHETHGLSETKEWRTWKGLKERCLRKEHKNYFQYGGRGIYVCDRWLKSFENFYSDMGARPSPRHTIDRIDNDGPYSPENCRWATRQEQVDNQEKTKWVEYNGERKTISEWAKRLGMNRHTLWQRLFLFKWSVEESFTRTKWSKKSRPKRTKGS